MTSLAQLWRSCGVHPDAVVGHGRGEVAAAYVAGGLSLEDAARVVTAACSMPGASDEAPAPSGERGEPRLDTAPHELLEALAGIAPRATEIPLYSALAGERIDAAELGPDHWHGAFLRPGSYEHVARLLAGEHRVFIEVGPQPVLAATTRAAIESRDVDGVAIATLQRDEGGLQRFLSAVAEAHVHGATPGWEQVFAGHRTVSIALPTYPFERESYWLRPAPAADVEAAGLRAGDHPLLGVSVDLPGGQEIYSARISLETHPWLAEHAILGAPMLPGAALVELVLSAARRTTTPEIEELALQAPLAVPARDAIQLQVQIDGPDDAGRRPLTVHARSLADSGGDEWTCHATGTLAAQAADAPPAGAGAWPPAGATPLDLTDVYARLAARGYAYGPLFRGMRSLWRDGQHLLAEIVLPEAEQATSAERFALHPAALDAALHPLITTMLDDGGEDELRLPFSWSGVRLFATGATRLRVRITFEGRESASLLVADDAGMPVAAIDSLAMRPLAAGALETARAAPRDDAPRDDLLALEWMPRTTTAEPSGAWWALGDAPQLTAALIAGYVDVRPCRDLTALREAVQAGGAVPEIVLASIAADAGGPEGTHATASQALELLQAWLAEDALAQSRLVLVTRGAVATGAAEHPRSLGGAAVWGLVRSAQAESPGCFTLVDLDDRPASLEALAAAVAGGEPQLALRDGAALVPRLARRAASPPALEAGGREWRMDITTRGALDDVAMVANPAAERPLEAGEVRIAVRAAGVNFKDVVLALGMVDAAVGIGLEGAGVVVDVADDVTTCAAGDRVMGIFPGAFAPLAIADHRTVTAIPAGWSFAEAASVPAAFLTAYYALVDLARLREGERLLVHSAAGGVGMAAVQLARHLGAETFGTASPPKWDAVRALGLDDEHISSLADAGLRAADPGGDRRRRRRRRARLVRQGVRRRVAAAAAARRPLRRDGQDRHPRPRARRRRAPGRRLPVVRASRRGGRRAHPADAGRADRAVCAGRAGAAAARELRRPPGGRRAALRQPGPAHRQGRAHRPAGARPRRHRPHHRRDR